MGRAAPANAREFIHQVTFYRMNDCFWPKGADQGATSVAREDHLLSQSLIEAVGALIASIWYR